MSAPTNTDFNKGFDFTSALNLTQADLNTLVDDAVPFQEADALEGKGLIISTKDTALNIPSVPDAASVVKWKRYIWERIPHSTAASTTPILYVWDNNIVSVATYLKWVLASGEAALQADVDALEASVILLQAQQANTSTQLNNVQSQSNANAAAIVIIQGQIPDLLAMQDAVNTTLPAADTANALAAAAALAAAQAAQVTANAANNNANTVAPASFFTSIDYAVADGVIADVLHNLGAAPKFIRWVLVAQATPDTGFTAGDEVDVDCFCMQDQQMPMFVYGANATKVFITKNTDTGDESVTRRDTGAILLNIDKTKWKARCYAWK